MAQKPNKSQRRNAFIFALQQQSSTYAAREVNRIGVTIENASLRDQIGSALARAYAAGACAALDCEDGRPRDENVAPL